MINFPEPYVIEPQPPGFIDFAEERLELGYDYGMVGGAEFKTEVIEVADGREQRNVLRHLPLGRWQLGKRNIADSDIDKLDEVSYLLKFHENRLGAKQGFRYKDWADYRGFAQVLGVGDGVKTDFQLRKAYVAGDAVTYRPIQKPVIGTVDVIVVGVNVAVDPNHTWIVDHETGIVSNDIPLANGAVLSANFEFDVPVWFESDEFPINLGYYDPKTKIQLYELGSIFVTEGRLPLTLPWDIAPRTEITEELNLGIVYQTTEKFQYKTTKLALNSGFTSRESKREDKRILFDYGERTFNQQELDTLLGYFWNARGKAGEFAIEDKGDRYIVRFNADKLNIKFEASTPRRLTAQGKAMLVASDDDALFKVSGLKLQLKEKVIFKLPPFAIPFEPIFVDPSDSTDINSPQNSNGFYSGNNSPNQSGENINPFQISSFAAEGVKFDLQQPPGEIIEGLVYSVRSMFWAGGTLNLLIAGSTGVSSYFNRLIHYRLLINNGWHFQYQEESSAVLREFLLLQNNFPEIFKTPLGVSVFLRASDQSPFNSGISSNRDGLLRFEIKDNGSFSIRFINKSKSPSNTFSSAKVFSLYGDKAYLTGVGSYSPTPIFFDGDLEFYKINDPRFSGGSLIPNGDLENRETNFNFWRNVNFFPDKQWSFRDQRELVVEFFARTSQKPNFEFVHGDDGSFFINFKGTQVCETNAPDCNVEEAINLFYFCHKSAYYSEVVLIDIQKSLSHPSEGNDFYLQHSLVSGSCDKYGNRLVKYGSKLIYYKAGSGYGLDISSQIGSSVSTIRNKPTVTPYGFALIGHSGNVFDSAITLVFIQNQS